MQFSFSFQKSQFSVIHKIWPVCRTAECEAKVSTTALEQLFSDWSLFRLDVLSHKCFADGKLCFLIFLIFYRVYSLSNVPRSIISSKCF